MKLVVEKVSVSPVFYSTIHISKHMQHGYVWMDWKRKCGTREQQRSTRSHTEAISAINTMNESGGNNLKGRNKTQKRSSVIAYRWNHFDVIEVNGKKNQRVTVFRSLNGTRRWARCWWKNSKVQLGGTNLFMSSR